MKKDVPMFADRKTHLTFDDVNLVTGLCSVSSRSDVDLSSSLPKGYELQYPVMTAAMDTITSANMALAIVQRGGAVVHHRNDSIDVRARKLRACHNEYSHNVEQREMLQQKSALNGVAVGIHEGQEDVIKLIESGANLICLELAHAHMPAVAEWVKEIGPLCREKDVLLMVGNFSHVGGVLWLRHETGDLVDMVKVSQGGGSACTTRLVAGIGKPTLQSVIDLIESDLDYHVVADGGIQTSGDLAKALGAGACAGMLGGMLAGTDETPGDIIDETGPAYKQYRGMASAEAKKHCILSRQGKGAGKSKNVEGVSTLVPYKGPVDVVFDQIRDGLQSAVASTGFATLEGFQKEAQFIRVSSASQREALPHAKNLK